MTNYIDIGRTDAYPTIGANQTDDGNVILTLTCYPNSSMMTVPMSAAVKLANKILFLANKQMKEAA